MHRVQQLDGIGTVYRADSAPLPGPRRYSLRLVPWYAPERPLAIGSWIELVGDEPLTLENEMLRLELSDGRWIAFRVTDVSETPPHRSTLIVQSWPAPHAE